MGRIPKAISKCGRVQPTNGHKFNVGDQYRLVLDGENLVVCEGVSRVAGVQSPTKTVMDAMKNGGCGQALGEVREVYPYSGSAEIAVI